MCDYLAEDIKPLIEQGVKFKYMTLISEDKELSSKTTKFVSEYFNVPESEIIETVLSPDQTAHLGPTSFGVTISVDFKEIK
jgi:hypothetical protein